VHDEERRRQPGAGNGEPFQERRGQARRQDMQPDIEQMVSEGRIAPQAVLKPKGAVQYRIILLRGAQMEPDAPEP
jgi:hypothetical protein